MRSARLSERQTAPAPADTELVLSADAPVPGRDPWPLTVATYNIHGAVGTDGRFAPERVAAVLDELQADVVALQEVPLGGADQVDVLALLRAHTGMFAAEGPTMESPARRYGNAVLSRYPILATESIDLSFGSREPRGALDADIDCRGQLLRVVATHLGLKPAERRAQIKRLLQAFDTNDAPVILLGDVNEWFMWGRTLRWLVGHFEAAPAPPTFPSRWPVFALDRIWISPRRRLQHLAVHRSALARVASDHLPLLAHIAG